MNTDRAKVLIPPTKEADLKCLTSIGLRYAQSCHALAMLLLFISTAPGAAQDRGDDLASVIVAIESNNPGFLGLDLEALRKASGVESWEELVRRFPESGPSQTREAGQGEVPPAIRCFLGEVPRARLSQHLARPERTYAVDDIHVTVARALDRLPPPALHETRQVLRTLPVWNAGATGYGEKVAVLDSGVDYDHPFIDGKPVAGACFSKSDGDFDAHSLCPGGEWSHEFDSGRACTGVFSRGSG